MNLTTYLEKLNNNLPYCNNYVEDYFKTKKARLISYSGRVLIKVVGKYFKLEANKSGNTIDEFKRWQKIRRTKYRKYFAKTRPVNKVTAKVEFVRGKLLYEFENDLLKENVMKEVDEIVRKVNYKCGIQLEDIKSYNVIYNQKSGKWKIIDF